MAAYDTVEDLKASDEYQAAGIIGRERMIAEQFPEVFADWRSATEANILSVAYDPDDMEVEGGFSPDD